MNESRPEKARAGWLERITNLAILGTLLILLLNPSGPIGSRVSRQVAETRERRTIENLWGGLTAPQSDVGDEQAAAGAPIVVEFLDYQCPACKAVAPAVSEAWKKGTATIVIRHLPLEEIHPLAEGSGARGRMCRTAGTPSRSTRSPDRRRRLGATAGLAWHGREGWGSATWHGSQNAWADTTRNRGWPMTFNWRRRSGLPLRLRSLRHRGYTAGQVVSRQHWTGFSSKRTTRISRGFFRQAV